MFWSWLFLNQKRKVGQIGFGLDEKLLPAEIRFSLSCFFSTYDFHSSQGNRILQR
jgi:hypothetical protein